MGIIGVGFMLCVAAFFVRMFAGEDERTTSANPHGSAERPRGQTSTR